jgi:hypothetical protein
MVGDGNRAIREMKSLGCRYGSPGVLARSEIHLSISEGLIIRFGVTGLSVPALISIPDAILAAANRLAADSSANVSDRRE